MTVRKRIGCLIAAGLILSTILAPVPTAQTGARSRKPRELAKSIQARMVELRAAGKFPGINIGVAGPDGKSWSVSAGYSDLEAARALKPSDRMLAGSIGKTYCAAVTLLAVQEGVLNLDDGIEKWLGKETWFDRIPNARALTLRMLMNHTSGIPEHVLNRDFLKALREQPDRVWKPEELIAYIFDAAPLFEAGKGWSYADTNFILVGMIFEKATGKTVYGEVERRLLKPLKLKETSPSDSRTIPGLATGYIAPASPFGLSGRTILDGRFIINPQMEWTGGGFASTAEDLARWARDLYAGRVLRQETFAGMLDAVPAKTGRGDKYGLGVQVRQSEWGISYGHGGWFPGYISEMEYFPDHKTAIAIQINTDDFSKLKARPRNYIFEVARILWSAAPTGAAKTQ